MAHTKVTKTHSQNTGVANTFSYSGSFDVFKGTEVQAELDNVSLTFTASTINESASPREYTVDTSAKTIHIGGADLSSGTIIIRPVTDMGAPTPRATYAPGSSVTSEDLNNNQTQLMRKAMEYDEQKLSSLGGTMTGHLTIGEDQTIIFEGATDDGYETTLTVTDPTADRTITLPNVTGTVVTTGDTGTVATGMIAADAITGAKIADDALNSEHYTDGSIDADHLAASSVTTAKINSDAVTGAKIADDAIDSEHYTDGSIDTAHIADSQITSAKIADGTIVAADLASDAVTTAKITDGNVTTAKIAADAITAAKIGDDVINSEHFAAGSIDTEHIADLNVTTAKIAADAVTQAKIADDAVGADQLAANAVVSNSIADGSVVNADVNASAAIAHTKLAAVPDGQIIVGSGSTVPTAVAVSGDVTLANDGAVTIAANAVEIGMIGCEQTTISDSDSHIPTSGAVVDYVAAQLLPFGGFEAIADEDNFPTSQPAAGVVISIKDATGVTVGGSGSSTTARTAGNGSDNVTINGFPSSMNSAAVPASTGLLVTSTGSSHTYNFHRLLPTTDDVRQLSDDVNDFFARYRINSGEPGSNNDEGDLVYDTAANKMKVYDGSSWAEVTSTGEFKYLFLCPAGGSGSPTLDGSIATYDLRESSNSGSAASVTNAAQLLVSVNGVIQKANTGTSAPAEGFALVDANTIVFGGNLASGDSVFIVQVGSAVSIPTPGDNTVTSAKIVDGAILNADINASAAIAGSKLADDSITEAKLDIHAAPTGTDKFLKYTSNGMEWVVPSYTTNTNTQLTEEQVEDFVGGMVTGNTETGITVTYEDSDGTLDFVVDDTTKLPLAGGTITGALVLDDSVGATITAATSSTGITLDLGASVHHSVTLAHNTTFADPSNEVAGQSGSIIITQDGTGSRTAAWNSAWKWAGGEAPTLTTTANAVDRIDYLVIAAGNINAVASLDVK